MSHWHLVTEDFPPGFVGGIASWAEDLASALVENGETVTVHARRCGDTAEHDHALPYDIRRMRGRSWSRWRGRWAQLSLAGTLGPGDRVLAATWGMSTQCLGAIKRKGAVLGIAFHGSDLTRLTEAPEDLQEVVDAATALLPVSNFLASELLRLGLVQPGDPRVRVLPIPLAEQPPARQGTGLVCVARPTPLKGIERVQALAAALELPLTLVGPDSSQGGTGLLTRSQTREAMAQAAAAVLLPRTDEDGLGAEGLGIVLLEAAAMGLVVIGCSTGGVPEAVGPGLLVDPDHPDLGAIRALLRDPQAGVEARSWVRTHHGKSQAVGVLLEALA
jgi:phosphatidylinositol alpha-1,6-mannosyltransferase